MAGFANRLARLFGLGREGTRASRRTESERERIRRIYDQFREILSLNDSILELIADIEDRATGRISFSMSVMARRIRQSALDTFVMVKDLDMICPGRYDDLYGVARGVNQAIERELAPTFEHLTGPVLLPLSRLSAGAFGLVGSKMANLGEIANVVRLNVPDGFAITTSAFAKFMAREQLLDKASRLEEVLDLYGPHVAGEACRRLQNEIIAAPLPPELEQAVLDAHARLGHGEDVPVAVRSSAVGEDKAISHAGQYYTELSVRRGWLLDAYRQVVASTFGIGPVTYRLQHGLTSEDAAMGVGCIRMIEPRCSGVLFTRDFNCPEDDKIVVSVTAGLGDEITSGRLTAEGMVIPLDKRGPLHSLCAQEKDIEQLAYAARLLERHFGGPQDIEWAIDREGKLFILQSRPMALIKPALAAAPAEPATPVEPLISGGVTACPGVAAGPVFILRADDDLAHVPDRCVLVANHSSPKFSIVMRKCAAIVTDVGSPIGHMAILAREYGVPAIVGLEHATQKLVAGAVVTVDAARRAVYDGALSPALLSPVEDAPLRYSTAVLRLRDIAPLVTPLKLIDPRSPDFTPANCRSLHDITRFVHEKVFEAVFYLGGDVDSLSVGAPRLGGNLPIDVYVLDVGGGLVDGADSSGEITRQDIISIPMKAFLDGLTDSRIRWDNPRAISTRGFMSVLGESLTGPPADARGVGRASFAIVSDRYMNFSTKAGYHFSTVDSFCDRSLNKNYIHFRFEGGAADEVRRMRRCRFLETVLGELKFKVQCRGDVLTGMLEKYECDFIRERLQDLGRATLCCRQLDMLMDADTSPDHFARAFLAGEFEKFF